MNPLRDKCIVVTRDGKLSESFRGEIEVAGAKILLYPCIEIYQPLDPRPLDKRVMELFEGEMDWLFLTSQNALNAVLEARKRLKVEKELPSKVKIAAVGAATAQKAVLAFGDRLIVTPGKFNALSLAETLPNIRGQSIFLPQSQIGNPEVQSKLANMGAMVSQVEAYRTVCGRGGVNLVHLLSKGKVDVITFASPSAVKFFWERFSAEGGTREALSRVCIACIGTTTKEAAIVSGLRVRVVAEVQTGDGLISSLKEYFGCGA